MINTNKFKYKKNFKGRIQNIKYTKINLFLNYGNYGLRAKENGRITIKQLELIRKFIIQKFSRYTKFWFYFNFNYIITRKPKEVRMGKGKGNFYIIIARIFKGRMLIEINCINFVSEIIFKKLRIIQKLFSINTLITLQSL
jgi:large subunit ribosomal protein L16